jgi:hypothetical protein
VTTTETDLPHTSELRFVDPYGAAIGVPLEWTPGFLLVDAELADFASVHVTVNNRPAEVTVRNLHGKSVVAATWPRAGPGWYDVAVFRGTSVVRHRLRIRPSKMSDAALGEMLEDLEVRLPVALALALRDAGARIGWRHIEPAQQTLASEVARLRRAVHGSLARPGLAKSLESIGSDPHRMLRNVGEWVKKERVRRPDPAGLVRALWRAGNLEAGVPVQVIDRRVHHDVDLYENRIVRTFAVEVERRLRRLRGVLAERGDDDLRDEVESMLTAVRGAKLRAPFIDEVSELRASPDRVTMVLLKRKEYRAAYEGFLEFRRRFAVQLDDPTVAEPLRNLPHLYQAWGTLLVLEAAIDAAASAGFRVHQQRLIWPKAGGLYVNVLADGRAAVDMRHPSGERLRVYPERSYGKTTSPLGSVSFLQKPDIAIELERPEGDREVLVFDPKYKLVSEEGAEPGDGTPKKVDVDKMHAYRDAIRDGHGRRVVRYAATLYPGISVDFGDAIGAIRMYPGDEAAIQDHVRRQVLRTLRR